MCLAVPMKIIQINDDNTGIVAADDASYKVSLSLIKDPVVEEFVIVHAGYAIEKLDEEEANTRIDLFRELAEVNSEMVKQ
ncbi:MAG: HypC/HybG/HupF family hydrogenase formation chaperone [Victivallales bacterium]|nr:HypC/HybG/HupF family hydrogenase formation chaperone [Victivallales bacterium]